MPCKDCPDPSLPADANCWIVYTGGTHEQHLAMMQHTLPDGYQKGHFNRDGSIQYVDGWEPAKPIDGYVSEDGRHFTPVWPSCMLRLYHASVSESCECIEVSAICVHPQVITDETERVTCAICENCLHRNAIPVREKLIRPPVPEPMPRPLAKGGRNSTRETPGKS